VAAFRRVCHIVADGSTTTTPGSAASRRSASALLCDAALTLDALADALGPAPTAAVDQHGDVADAADGGERIAQRTTALTSLSNHHARRGPAGSDAEMAIGGWVPPGIPWP
jgi:hypothetical protein